MKKIDVVELKGLLSSGKNHSFAIDFGESSSKSIYFIKDGDLNPFYVDSKRNTVTAINCAIISTVTVDGEKIETRVNVYWLNDLLTKATLKEGAEVYKVAPDVVIDELEDLQIELKYDPWKSEEALIMELKIGSSSLTTMLPIEKVKVLKKHITFRQKGRNVQYDKFNQKYSIELKCAKTVYIAFGGKEFEISFTKNCYLEKKRKVLPSLDEEVIQRIELKGKAFLFKLNKYGFFRADRLSYNAVTVQEFDENPGDWNDSYHSGEWVSYQRATNEKWGDFVPSSREEVLEVLNGDEKKFNRLFNSEYLEAFKFNSEQEKRKVVHQINKCTYNALLKRADQMKQLIEDASFLPLQAELNQIPY